MTSETSAHLQCVPYARRISGIEIHGNAKTRWKQAEDHYQRGTTPKPGAVMALAATDAMPLGHVAVIDEVVDKRHVLIDHANWSAPGMIEHRVLAEDVSADGDWSLVRIFYAPIGGLGSRANPVSGFIYPNQAEPSPASAPLEFARADQTEAATLQGSSRADALTRFDVMLSHYGDAATNFVNEQSAQPDVIRWRIALIVLVAISLIFQSLLVQTHLHAAVDQNGRLVAGQTSELVVTLDSGFGHKPSQCLLCQERSVAGHYTSSPSAGHVDAVSRILFIPALPALTAIYIRRGLASRHPRGPPLSIR